MTGALPALVRLPNEGKTKGNALRAHRNSPSAEISTNLLGVSGQIAISSTNALVVHQVVTLNVDALESRKRKCTSEVCKFEMRGKRPQYVFYIWQR